MKLDELALLAARRRARGGGCLSWFTIFALGGLSVVLAVG